MKDIYKTKKQLIKELEDARREISRGKAERGSVGAKPHVSDESLSYQRDTEFLLLVRKAIDSTADAIALSDPEGRHIYHNKAFIDMFGYAVEDLGEAGGFALFSVGRIAREVLDSIMGGRSWIGEVEVRAKSGREFGVYLRADAIKDDGGKVVGLVQVFTDITERKLVEYKLKRKHDELQLILDSIPAYVFYKDKDGKMLNINEAAMSLASAPKEKLLNKTVFDLVPRAADKYNKDDMEVIKSGQPKKNIEELLELPSGERWLKTDKLPIKDDTGSIVGLVGFSVDITDRKKAQDELAQSEALLRSFFNSPGLICGVVEIEGGDIRYITVNGAMAAMYGLKPDDVSNKLAGEIGTDKEIVELFIENYGRSRNTNAPAYFEYHRGSGAETRWLSVMVTYLGRESSRKKPRFAFITSDITEHRKAEQALRTSEEKLRVMFESMTDAVVLSDLNGVIQDINSSAERMFGYKKKEVIGINGLEVIAFEDKDRAVKNLAVSMYGPEIIGMQEFNILDKNRSRINTEISVNRLSDSSGKPYGFIVVVRDISARKVAEEALRESEAQYRVLTGKMTDIIWTLDMNLNSTYVSPSITRILGYTPEERLVQPVKDQLTPESYEHVIKTLSLELERDGMAGVDPDRSVTIEVEYYSKDGSTVWMENVVSAIRDEQGKPVMLHGVSRDITERKRAQEALRESEQKLRWMFESINEGIFIVGMDGRVLEANAGVEKITGYSRAQLLGKSGLDYMFPGFKGKAMGMLEKMIGRGGTHGEVVIPMRTADGDSIEVEATSSTLRDSSGKPIGLIGIFRDVSERKRMEGALRDSEEKLRLVFASMADGIVVTDIEGYIIDVNEAQMRMFGFDEKSELIGKGGFDFLAERERGRALAEMFKVYEEGFNTGSTYTVVDRSGREFECELSTAMLHDAEGKPSGTVTVMRDVSERKRMEQAIRESEKRYRLLTENATDAIWTIDMNLKYTFISPSILRILKGYSLEELLQMSIQDMLAPASFSAAASLIEEELARERTEGIDPNRARIVELELQNKDGSTVWAEIQASFIRDSEGNVIGVQGSTRDITERLKAQQLIKDSEERYRLLAENVSDIIWTMDLSLRFTYISPSVLNMRGYTVEEALGMSLEETVAPGSMKDILQVIKEEFEVDHTEQYTSRTIEVELRCKNGSTVWTEMKLSWLHDPSGNRVGIMGVTRDITKRRKVAEALRETSEKLRVVFDSIGEAITVVDLNGDIVDANKEALRLYEFNSKDAIIGLKSSELVAPGDRDRAIKDAIRVLRPSVPSSRDEYKLIDSSGKEFDGEFNVAVMRDDRGNATGFIGIARDISERKLMEEALRNSEERYRNLVENASEIIFSLDAEGRITYISPSVEAALGYKSAELIDHHFKELILQEDFTSLADGFGRTLRGEKHRDEIRVRARSGDVRVIRISVKTVSQHGKIVALTGVATDITERKQAEEALQRSEEKLRVMFDSMMDGIVVSDKNLAIVDVNRAAVEIMGVDTKEELLGRNAMEVIRIKDQAAVQANLVRMFREERSQEKIEYGVVLPSGKELDIEVSTAIMKDSAGSITGFVNAIRDITERKRAEETLLRINKAIEGSSDAIGMSDPEGRHFYNNEAFTELFGYTADELEAAGGGSAVYADKEVAREVFDSIMHGKSWSGELEMMSRSGRRFPVLLRADAVKDESGKIIGLIGTHTDISERKKWETALKDSEEKYRSLVERERDVIVSVDALGFVQSVNSAVTAWGYTQEEVSKMNFLELIAPEWQEVTATELQNKLLDTGEYIGETVVVRKDGEKRTIEYSAVAIREGDKYSGAQAIVRDISERKKAEEALQARERYFRAISDQSSGAALVVNLEGNIMDVTGGLERISGHTRESTIGRTAIEFIHPDDMAKAGQAFDESMRNPGKTVSFEARLKNARGEWQWTESMITNLLDNPDVHGIVNHLVDITERKKIEEDIRTHARRIEALYSVAQVIGQSLTLDDMLKDSLNRVCNAMGTESALIYMLDLDENALKLKSYIGMEEDIREQFSTISLTEQGIENIMKVQGPVTEIDEEHTVVDVEGTKGVTAELGRKSVAAAPLFRSNELQGFLVVFSSKERRFSREDLDLFKAIANEISLGINNLTLLEQTREMSVTDELTGLYNRRYFFEMMDVEISRAERTNRPFSVVMMDLDGFKEYNDKYGHSNGDAVLEGFARVLTSSIRKSDLAFRYGGDEFALILSGADSERAKKIVQRMRARWEKAPLKQPGTVGGQVGFSSGIAEYPANAESPDGLVFLADAALYQAKRKGYEDKLVSELRTLSTNIMDVATQDQVYALAATVDARDPYTYGHSQRVADTALRIGRAIGLSTDDLAKLHAAALLHDIGKVGVPDAILTKPGKPSSEEWDLIRKHCAEGARIVGYVKEMSSLVPIVLHHHEWYDGSGYPASLKGLEIPPGARITAVADAYDTMVTKRPYKDPITPSEACEELKRSAGTQFDPVIVEVWCKLVEEEEEQKR